MLCAIYKSPKEAGMYLYIEKRNQFDGVPEALLKIFGKPIFVMLFNLAGEKPLVNADKTEVLQNIREKGFYLQTPKKDDWLFSL
ncbi:YcgL domain-containing protein [Aggregatibacter actinomycetemcomitans]|uniref:YcgL domain-containing protein n=1 Tax=Aggregatibacter actinomycetemcomitans TaxID=714 RepID=UPI00197BDDEB|nr:YcgL domain-containing protein [Aggregatibacter actinomycetemcomitans]MBN6070981.1 YcgL domain-containing protein [Aggregatibacter actinomycetemcomitans]MBN6073756.1 YcgL domain-containing protein [Aggregatibacter actinomycetemcomitans]